MALSFRGLIEFEAHHRTASASSVAALTFAVSARGLRFPVTAILSRDALAFCSAAPAWAGMIFADARTCLRKAHLQDSSRAAICGRTVLGAIAGLFGGGTLPALARDLKGNEFGLNVLLAGVTVLFSWLLVHTMLVLHYPCVLSDRGEVEGKTSGHGTSVPLRTGAGFSGLRLLLIRDRNDAPRPRRPDRIATNSTIGLNAWPPFIRVQYRHSRHEFESRFRVVLKMPRRCYSQSKIRIRQRLAIYGRRTVSPPPQGEPRNDASNGLGTSNRIESERNAVTEFETFRISRF